MARRKIQIYFLYNSKIMMIIKNEKKNYASCGDLGGGGDYPHIIMRTLVHIFIFESSSPLVLARI
jgi:hypothetical protein